MKSTNKKNHHVYDFVIIGGGVSGLCVANALAQKTTDIALIEAQDVVGGYQKPVSTPLGLKDNGLRFFPNSQKSVDALKWLSSLLQVVELNWHVEENPIYTVQLSNPEFFLGFGEETPPYYEEISYFLSSEKISVCSPTYNWVQGLLRGFKGDVLYRSIGTQLEENENGEIFSISLNKGHSKVYGRNFIYCGSIKELSSILPEKALSVRARQKLSKSKYTSALCLDLVHNPLLQKETGMFVLNGPSADPIRRPNDRIPMVGYIHPAVDLGQFSQWVTYFDSDDHLENEWVGSLIKRMKKIIKKAFPKSFDGISYERILVIPHFSGSGELKIQNDHTFSEYKNLYMCSASLQRNGNLVSAIHQAKSLFENWN